MAGGSGLNTVVRAGRSENAPGEEAGGILGLDMVAVSLASIVAAAVAGGGGGWGLAVPPCRGRSWFWWGARPAMTCQQDLLCYGLDCQYFDSIPFKWINDSQGFSF